MLLGNLEGPLGILLFIILLIALFFIIYNFFYFLRNNKIKTNEKLFKSIQLWTIVVVPAFYIYIADIGMKNDCCGDSALFSPNHRIEIYTLLITYTLFYVISIFRRNILPPIAEVFVNSFLILGLIINVLLCFHITDGTWIIGNIPIILLLLLELSKNQQLLAIHIEQNELTTNNSIGKICFSILKLNPFLKYPVLAILLIPFIILISLIVLLFGQKPDSLIRAFTDTYKHGFSKLDHLCDNVDCGGHFLCSVGANGHRQIVSPIRYGERNGNKIICNRQLLIANAFEELIETRFPKIHRMIRKNYNKVGSAIHRHYHIFNNKLVSDIIYILMKPLEYFFLLTLYTFENNPENIIAKQYLTQKHRETINHSK